MTKKTEVRPTQTFMIRGVIALKPGIQFLGPIPTGRERGATVVFDDPSGSCLLYLPDGEPTVAEFGSAGLLATELRVLLDEEVVKAMVTGAEKIAEIGPPPGEAVGIETVLRRVSETADHLESSGALNGLRTCYGALRTAINRVLSLAKDDFGQYWIDTVDPYWETPEAFGRIGEFFRHIDAEYSLDGLGWKPVFLPISQREDTNWIAFVDLLTVESWAVLAKRVNNESNLSLHLVSRARSAFMQHDYRTAIITMVTAVERELVSFVQRELAAKGIDLSDQEMQEMSRHYGLTFMLETLAIKMASSDDLDAHVRAVKKVVSLRNKLVHGKGSEREIESRLAREHLDACIRLLRAIVPPETPVHWFASLAPVSRSP